MSVTMAQTKKKGKKPNPTWADIGKAQTDGCNLAVTICMTVLYDKFGFDNDEIVRFWNETAGLSQEIKDGRIYVGDLLRVLKEEYGVMF